MRKALFAAAMAAVWMAGSPLWAQIIGDVSAQKEPPRQAFRSEAERQQAAEALLRQSLAEKQAAEAAARRYGWPIRGLVDGRLYELVGLIDGRPVYEITNNVNAAITTAADLIRNTPPYNLNGLGWKVGVWDAGAVRPSHQEFMVGLVSRVTVVDAVGQEDHSTHVAGTIGAAGVVANAMGMAPSVSLDSYDWNSDTAEMTAAGASAPGQPSKICVSNHSYGTVVGWDTGNWSGTQGPHWFGVWNEREDRGFGNYNSKASQWDQLCYNLPYYLPFKSAGNDRGNDAPSSGTTFWYWSGGWQSKAYDPATDPYSDDYDSGGYDTIPSYGCAKNIMTLGAVNDAVLFGGRSTSQATMASFSSWGPTDDGRVKPDIVANGIGLYSTVKTSDTAYASYSGTSMSSPNAVGSALLLVEYGAELFPGFGLLSCQLKGLIIHTADDLGNAGPDYRFGWGLMNVKAAADHLKAFKDYPGGCGVDMDVLSGSNPSDDYAFTWDGVSPIRATLCWTDPAAGSVSGLDNPSLRLINDLDLRVLGPGGSPTYYPYVLDPSNPSVEATTGDNTRDNVEQVYIASPPTPGRYTARVAYKGSLTNGEQRYGLSISGQRLSDSSAKVWRSY